VVAIAHRRSSATAPESTLAAFRLAAEQGADFIEFDVQVGRWGSRRDALQQRPHENGRLRAEGLGVSRGAAAGVDIGSRTTVRFSAERLPTLAVTLAARGRSRVIVELKSYGHDQRLEEKVVEIVEAAAIVNDSVFMSLDHNMVRRSSGCGHDGARLFRNVMFCRAEVFETSARRLSIG
jgi:glycerophosphoryl diester phosphodiesterase